MKSIKEKPNKIKEIKTFLFKNDKVFYFILILLVSFSSFALGKLSALEKKNGGEIALCGRENFAASVISATENNPVANLKTGKYVASKNSDKYHAPWCSGASRIKEENQIWFQTKEEAEQAGYSPASNCKGL